MSNTTQDTPDSVYLFYIGSASLTGLIETSTFTIIYGAFAFLFAQAITTYVKRKNSSRAQFWMFLACTVMFLLATAHEATTLASSGILIHSALMKYPGLTLAEKIPLLNTLLKSPSIITIWITNFEVIASDCIVVWRASVLLQRRWWLIAIPSLLLLASIALLMVDSISSTIGSKWESEAGNYFYTVASAISLGTNVIATAFIGYIYWAHRKTVKGLRKNRATQSERVLALLIESGVVFCVPQAVSFGLQFTPNTVPGTTSYYAQIIFMTAYYGFSVMYPTIVVSLVNSQRSFDHVYLMQSSLPTISNGEPPRNVTTIHFTQSNSVEGIREISQGAEKRLNEA
ncbi:hypothetical protein BDZ94DRAFT_1303190 [Collybia nuda]|uniref:Uncharacterized protein n=1 Tax=Collybia nuda TaxID=64659 RepID=A0A9P5YKX6_9AGAR|nr:hypothetical protein BDZ94DRAFT_1303190 [Collybia nuda]